MKTPESVEIQILGRKYYFRSDDPEGLIANANFINSELEKLNARFNTVDQNKLLIYFALILTEKNNEQLEENKNLSRKLEELNKLLSAVNFEIDD